MILSLQLNPPYKSNGWYYYSSNHQEAYLYSMLMAPVLTHFNYPDDVDVC